MAARDYDNVIMQRSLPDVPFYNRQFRLHQQTTLMSTVRTLVRSL